MCAQELIALFARPRARLASCGTARASCHRAPRERTKAVSLLRERTVRRHGFSDRERVRGTILVERALPRAQPFEISG
jgi:hypothetical protein